MHISFLTDYLKLNTVIDEEPVNTMYEMHKVNCCTLYSVHAAMHKFGPIHIM